MGAVDIGGGAIGSIPAHARTINKVGPVDRQGIGYPSRRRRGRVQARRRRDWVVDREGLGIGGPASRRTGEDGHTGRPGRGNVRSQDGSRQLGAVDIGGGAIGSIPAHSRAVNKVGPVDRQGIGYPPAVAEVGFRLVVVGTGLLIVKVWALEVPPPGVPVKTVTLAVPAVAMSAARMEAVSWVLLT